MRSLLLAAFAVCLPVHADPLDEAAEVTTASYLGIELPLRPGERVVPTASSDCSVVVFAPHEERYERFAAYWRTAEWQGYCRFGL
ncbi:MAG: hypothetical protein ACK4P2_09525, partial [Hyphomonas sp.]